MSKTAFYPYVFQSHTLRCKNKFWKRMVTVLRWSSWGPIVKYHKFWVFIVIGTFSCLLLNVCSIYIYSGKKIHEFYRGVFFIIGKTCISQARNLLLRQVAYVSESWDEEEANGHPPITSRIHLCVTIFRNIFLAKLPNLINFSLTENIRHIQKFKKLCSYPN